MFLMDEMVQRFYPLYEKSDKNPAVQKLGEYLDVVYNKQGSWKVNGVSPQMGEVAELYDIYKHIVHDGASLDSVTTISQNVSDILKSFGFNANKDGVGWRLSGAYEKGGEA